MPLCPQCKSDAETSTHSPPPSRLSRFLSGVFSTPPTPPEGECSRCDNQCDACDREF